MRFKIVLSLAIFLTLTLGFNGFLLTSSFKKNNRLNYYSLTTTIGKRIKMYIETGLIFGKKLDTFYGLKKLLRKNIKQWSFITDSIVTDPRGNILCTAYPLRGITDIFMVKLLVTGYRSHPESNILKSPSGYMIALPIEKHHRIKGYLVLLISKMIDARAQVLVRTQAIIMFIIIITSFLSLLALVWWVSTSQGRLVKQISLSRIIPILFVSFQLIYAVVATQGYQKRFSSIIQQKIFYIHDSLVHDLQYLLSKGVSLNRVTGMEAYLQQILSSNMEIKSIEIMDMHHHILYKVERSPRYSFILQRVGFFQIDKTSVLVDRDKRPVIYVKTTGNPEFIFNQGLGMYLDTVTIIILCLIFLGELNRIFSPLLYSLQHGYEEIETSTADTGMKFLRIIAFLFFFSYDMPMSFIPLYMKQFHIMPLKFIPVDVILSLPITAEIVCATISTMFGGIVTERLGWNKSLIFSIVFATTGLLIAGFFPNPWIYILARSLAGLALGLILISLQSSIAHTQDINRANAISNIFAGVLAGSLCGNVVGAMLADQQSYSVVFIVAGIMSVVISGYIVYLLKRVALSPSQESHSSGPVELEGGRGSLWSWADVKTLSLIICIAMPVAMTMVGILYYLIPVYLKEIGTSQGNIGRVIMIYGLCIIYGAPFISRMVEGRDRRRVALVTGFISLLSLVPFIFLKGILPSSISILFVGLANALGAGCLVVYFLDLTSSSRLSEHRRISIYRGFERMGQILGSVLFAFFVGSFGMNMGLGILLGCFAILLVAFYLIQHGRDRDALSTS